MAQGGYAGIQFSYSGGNHAFFNANTGDVWEYGDHGNFRNHYKVHEVRSGSRSRMLKGVGREPHADRRGQH
jgi:hypothetical protein